MQFENRKCIFYNIFMINRQEEQNQSTTVPLHIDHIIQAFRILREGNSGKKEIEQADSYLFQCEKSHEFIFLLMEVFSKSPDSPLQKQVLIHLKNVIKRNWTNRRRSEDTCKLTEQVRQHIRSNILTLYMSGCKNFVFDFNEIIRFLARQDYPVKYPQLHKFMKDVLNGLACQEMEVLINSEELFPFLSTIKVIMKEFSQKRISHTKQLYDQYLAQILDLSLLIEQKITQISKQIFEGQQYNPSIRKLLMCSEYVDKILLHTLNCLVSEQQGEEKIVRAVESLIIGKVKLLAQYYVQLTNQNIKAHIEIDLSIILELSVKMQQSLPFIFGHFLESYFNVLIQLFCNMNFANERLVNNIIIGVTKPLCSYTYYMSPEQFKNSIYSRKSNCSWLMPLQEKCYQIFMNTFGGNNAREFLEQIILKIMPKFQRLSVEDEILFEDSEAQTYGAETTQDKDPFELMIVLMKNLITRFKEQCRPLIDQILTALNSEQQYDEKVLINMSQLVLLLPKILDEEDLPMEQVFRLVEKAFQTGQSNLFIRLIRNYMNNLNDTILNKCFLILTEMITREGADHRILYQSAVCVKKLLCENDEGNLPLDNLGKCMGSIVGLLEFYKNNPTHLWNLINLINQLMKIMSREALLAVIPALMHALTCIVQSDNNDELAICGLADLLQNILEALSMQTQYPDMLNICMVCFTLIERHINNTELENINSLYLLWLRTIKQYEANNSPPQLNNRLLTLFNKEKANMVKEEPATLAEIIEEYLLSGLLVLSQPDMIQFFRVIMEDNALEHQHRVSISLFSLYFTYSLLTNTYISDILIIAIKQLQQLTNKISPSYNAIRTQLMMIINHHILTYDANTIFQLFTNVYGGDYRDWYYTYIWSSTYVTHKYAFKLNTMATIQTIPLLVPNNLLLTPIGDQVPVDTVLKNIAIQVQPIKRNQAMLSYLTTFKIMFKNEETSAYRERRQILMQNSANKYPRKIRLHINAEWAENDLSVPFRNVIGGLLNSWGWGEDDLNEHFDKSTVAKIMNILVGETQTSTTTQ